MLIEQRKNEKLYIVSQMAASIAHEIRNPMTTINGFLQLLKQDKLTPKTHEHYYSLMLEESERAEAIITDYLSLTKTQSGKKEVIDIKEEINFVVKMISSYGLLHGIDIKNHNEDSFYIYGRVANVRQVLVNIIKNGIEASEHKGKIDIFVRKSYEHIMIKIRDYGRGMDQQQIKKLGMPFYSTKGKGTGLGLTVCFNIIKSMDGHINIRSEIGKGTCFELVIPEMKK